MSFDVQDIRRTFGSGSKETVALDGVSMAARDGEFVSIIGPSGCGKTTLLKIIGGLVTPTSGKVRFHNKTAPGRLRTSLVFQEHGLLPWYDVLENVALGLRFQLVDRADALSQATHFIQQVGLERFIHHHPHQLSIGMRQRVGIARAFVANPDILLLDEPFGALDAQTKLVLQQELLRIWQEHRKTVVHVTHDIEEAILLSDRIVVMTGRPGKIREEITLHFPRPRSIDTLGSPEAGEVRRRIWASLQEEVKRSLWLAE